MQYSEKFPTEIQDMFSKLKSVVYGVAPAAEERTWAGLPSYYVGEKFVRIIPFKDHLNVEAAALQKFKPDLPDYKFTPKNMLQIFVGQEIPLGVLTEAFRETLI